MNRHNDAPQRRTGPERLQLVVRLGMYALILSLVFYLVYTRYAGGKSDAPPENVPPAEGQAQAAGRVEKSPSASGEFQLSGGGSLENSTIRPAVPLADVTPATDNESRLVVGIDDIHDGPGLEPEPLYYLLDKVVKLGEKDVSITDAPVVSVTTLTREPSRWRGQPVSLTGSIKRLYVMKLEPNPSGVTEMWDGWAVTAKGSERYLCRFLCPKKEVPLKVGHVVQLRGLFMKVYRYASDAGPQEAPVVVVFKPQVTGGGTGLPSFEGGGLLVMALVILLVIYFLMMIYVQRRKQYMYERVEARRKATLARLRQSENEDESTDASVQEEPDEPGAR